MKKLLMAWRGRDRDATAAWLMTAAFVVMLAGAIVAHGNWIATWFAFSGAWFAWQLPLRARNKTPNA